MASRFNQQNSPKASNPVSRRGSDCLVLFDVLAKCTAQSVIQGL